jgi:ribosomal protein S18 acetylase RimI-like enzyme
LIDNTTAPVNVRNTRREDIPAIIDLCRRVYPDSPPWNETQLASHLKMFPEGQFVAVRSSTGRLVGMAASLIVSWDDYHLGTSWRDFTDYGMFTNHDPENGRTLYGAEIMVDPAAQGRGVGRRIYDARRDLARRLRLRRIRAGARLRGYGRYADRMSAEEYVQRVVRHEIRDPTLTFQLRRGFHVLAVIPEYLHHDPESRGYAAVIEWINREVATRRDWAERPHRFEPSRRTPPPGGKPPGRR